MIANQLMRRNLTDERRKYYRGLAYEATKQKQGGTGANQHTEQSGNDCQSANTAKKLAERFGVSERTVRNAATYAKAVDALPSAKQREAVLSGKEKLQNVAKPAKSMPKPEADAKTTEEEKPAAPILATAVQTANFSDIMNGMVAKQLVGHIRHFLDGAIRVASAAPCKLSPADAETMIAACGLDMNFAQPSYRKLKRPPSRQ